jgi:[histone H3]-lysine9 N-trimethyltransferase SUV39H
MEYQVVQQGRRYPVNIVKTEYKGWGQYISSHTVRKPKRYFNLGVFAGDKRIPEDTFLGIYAGELLTDEAGEERGMFVLYFCQGT